MERQSSSRTFSRDLDIDYKRLFAITCGLCCIKDIYKLFFLKISDTYIFDFSKQELHIVKRFLESRYIESLPNVKFKSGFFQNISTIDYLQLFRSLGFSRPFFEMNVFQYLIRFLG